MRKVPRFVGELSWKITALKGKVKSLSEGPEQNKFVWIASDLGGLLAFTSATSCKSKKSTKEAWKAIEKFHHDITWIYTKLHHLGTLYSTSKCLHLYITPKNIKKILPDSNYPFNQINQTNLRGITPATSVV